MTAIHQPMTTTRIQHDPRECKAALARTVSPVVVDLETTGLERHDQIVSAGLFIDGTAHILFARSRHASITNHPLSEIYDALRPLERPDLVIVGHNALFDLGCLRREGIVVGGEVRDTLKLLRLIDQDRGPSGTRQGDSGEVSERRTSEVKQPRSDLTAPDGVSSTLNYKLKDVVGQLLGIRMPHFPGSMALLPYEMHARYLACDLIGTWKLCENLWPRLTEQERSYYQTLINPLIHVLVGMGHIGVQADPNFAVQEARRADELRRRLSEEHCRRFGIPLTEISHERLIHWLYTTLHLPVLKHNRFGHQWCPSLDKDTLKQLAALTEDEKARVSIALIQDHRRASSLVSQIRSTAEWVDAATGMIYSKFDDSQATGRVSSTYPNLQQLAKLTEIAGEKFRSRNLLRASPGYELAVFDIGQADIRALAHSVETFSLTTEQFQHQMRRERHARLNESIGGFDRREELRNPDFRGEAQEQPTFLPSQPPDLAADFADSKGDFYSIAARRILGRPPNDKAERNRFKVVILSTVNGQGSPSLAKALGCIEPEAKTFLADFEKAYPKVAAFKQLMHWQIAYTGQTRTFLGRPRTITAQRWMVSEPRVEILISFENHEVCWLDVVPLEPAQRVLTTYVLKAWNARTGKLIYDHDRGRRSGKWYHLFEENSLYRLPIRNWAWRSIRRVRFKGEEAVYEGFDKAARMAFNHICQGGTADICKLMMLRAQPVCREFGARLLIQIHDELVFEVPKDRADAFLATMKQVLEQPPIADFKVPIVVEAKRGERFGELTTLA